MWRMIAQHALRNDRLHLLGSESGVEESSTHSPYTAGAERLHDEAAKSSSRQRAQGVSEHKNATFNVASGGKLVGTVAVSAAAGYEQHRHRSDSGHEQGVVISATGHGQKIQTAIFARLSQSIHYRRVTVCGRVCVQQFGPDRDPASF